jgi:hypothetical protein
MRVFLRLLIILIGMTVWGITKILFHGGGILEAGVIAAVTIWAANAVNKSFSKARVNLEFSNSLPSESQSLIEQKIRETEEGIYEFIAEEFETNSIDKGLWLRLFSECGGDETQAKVLYIKQRFEKLAVIERARIKEDYYK